MPAMPSRSRRSTRRDLFRLATASAVLLLTSLIASPAHAQFVELDPGTRIRLRAPAAVAGQLTGVVIAATGGALTGALVGAIIGTERWERAALPLRVGVRPLSGGGVRVAVRWGR